MKIVRKTMIIFSMLVGIYFVAGDVQNAGASPSCYNGCSVNYSHCWMDYGCDENPNNIGCNFCENRYESCVVNCQIGRPGSVPR